MVVDLTEEPPNLQDEPLTIAEQALLDHWKQFRPRTVASLSQAGMLEQTVRQSLWNAQLQEVAAVADGMTVDEAREATRDFLYGYEALD